MKAILLCFTLVVYLQVSFGQISAGCTQDGAWNDTAFANLIQQLQSESNELVREDILENSVAQTAQGFTAKQTVQLLMEFENEIIAEEILVNISRWILALYSSDVALILEQWNNELTRLEVLPYLVNLTLDLRTENATILAEFSNIFNKRDALEIIENAVPISCVWGNLTPKRLIFVVDTSGSMSTTFVDGETGTTYTRLQYVAIQLNQVIKYNLQPYQEFNVISFSDYPHPWSPGVVPVNPANVNSAISFVSGLNPGGGTAMLSALQSAFSDPNAVAIYLLSDGEPTDSSFQQILSAALRWSQSGTPPKQINAISFQAGGTYDPNAAQFMYQLAQETGGIFRAIS